MCWSPEVSVLPASLAFPLEFSDTYCWLDLATLTKDCRLKLHEFSLTPGMPFNQLGTLAGSKYYNVEAMYCYLRW